MRVRVRVRLRLRLGLEGLPILEGRDRSDASVASSLTGERAGTYIPSLAAAEMRELYDVVCDAGNCARDNTLGEPASCPGKEPLITIDDAAGGCTRVLFDGM